MSKLPPLRPVAGVHRLVMEVSSDDGVPLSRDVFRFTLSELTAASMLGTGSRWTKSELHDEDLHAPLSRIPLGNFARWIFQEKQRYWRDEGVMDDTRVLVDELLHHIEREPLNDVFATEASHRVAGSGVGWLWAALPDDHELAPGAEVVLFLDAHTPGLSDFVTWYGQRLEAAKDARIAQQCEALRTGLGHAVSELDAAYASRRKVREQMMPYMQKLQGGATVIEICLDFARPPEERVAMWKTWQYAEREYVSPPPDAGWRERAERLRMNYDRDIIHRCAEVMNSRHSQELIDAKANAIVDQLRAPGAAYLRMLDEWDELCAGARAELLATVRRAFSMALRSEPARKRLLDGELVALGRLAAELGSPIVPPRDTPERAALANAVERFDASVLGSEEETPFGKMLATKFSSVAEFRAQSGLACEILGLATPFIVAKIKRGRGLSTGSTFDAIAWTWCALVGSTGFSKEVQNDFWKFMSPLLDLDGSRTKYEDYTREFKLFDYRKGVLKAAYAKSNAVFQMATVLSRVIMVHYTAAALEKKPGDLETKLEHFKSLADFLKSTIEVVADPAASSKLISLVERANGTKSVALNAATALGIVADGLSFAISVDKYVKAKKTKKTRKTTEAAELDVMFDGLSFAVTVIAALTGAELLLIGGAVFAAKKFVTDPDSWMHLIPGTDIEKKAAPHAFLEKLLQETLDDTEFDKLIARLAPHGSEVLRDQIDRTWGRLEPAPRSNTTQLWDLGGAPHLNLEHTARIFARAHWGLSQKMANSIIRPCSHD